MFLKRVVLHGFKSFADRTEFDFGSGVTAIVGPNGCGKSNVLDAVRWVLGEQSAKTLRAGAMQEVIFNGSRSRKPANFAEVELVFDNTNHILPTDDKDVSVGRILYRSGESEYRLSGNICRLKDIRDLMLDTGVGVDAYSVIEQGKVDQLLQASPIERREIFEEAAGVSRYRVRRTEAQRKLERSQNNLLRLNDLVDELEKRLRSVKLAAGKARNWQEYDGRLRELRSTHALSEYHRLQAALAALGRRSAALGDVVAARRADLAGRDEVAAGLEREHAALDERLQQAETELAALQSEISTLTERTSQGGRRLEELTLVRTQQLDQAQELAHRAAELETRVGQEAHELAEMQATEQQANGRVQELDAERRQAEQVCISARQELERERTAAFDAARRIAAMHNEQTNLERQQERLARQQAGIQQRLAENAGQQQSAAQRQTEREAAVAELDRRLAEVGAAVASIEQLLTAQEAGLRSLAQEADRLRESRTGLLSRLRLLEDLEQRGEGVDGGTRWVLGWRDQQTDKGSVVGLVADLLRIDDARVAMIQGVLNRFERQLVVRSSHTFLAELARRGDAPGPVEVLALDRLAPNTSLATLHEADGIVAPIIDWVRCEPEFRVLAEHLLSRTFLVDSIERALALAASAPAGFTFVAPGDQIVDSGGTITVGAQRGAMGLISRKAEIRQLRTELEEVESRLDHVQRQRFDAEQRIADLQLERKSQVAQVQTLQRERHEAAAEVMRVRDEIARLQREAGLLEREGAELARLLEETLAAAQKISADCGVAESAQQGHEGQMSRLTQDLSAHEAAVGRMVGDLTAARVELGRVAERRAARERAVSELKAQHARLQREQQDVEQRAAEAGQRITATQSEITQAAERLTVINEQGRTAEAACQTLRVERAALRRQIEACGATVRRLHADIEEADTVYNGCEMERREVAVRSEELVRRIQEEMSIDLAALYESYQHAEQDWDAIQAEIEELRRKITRLGNVNLDAITELEELSPRYDGMLAQRQDLLDSIGQLEGLIAELDEESKKRFVAAFEQIRAQFGELFRKLFGGGKADIILEDPERLLECGIEIIARPPGKEPQSLSLLSGGEKTMTAVALLFAVFCSRPSPFLILDEVDAALDESNVGRFNTMLDEYLSQTDFIIITHNKRTMQSADVMYGITMEEPGVSKRVGVRIDDCAAVPVEA